MKYTVTRTSASGGVSTERYPTYRRAFNAVVRMQARSSKTSVIVLAEDGHEMDRFPGLN